MNKRKSIAPHSTIWKTNSSLLGLLFAMDIRKQLLVTRVLLQIWITVKCPLWNWINHFRIS